jgi:hypothetical protein
VKLTFMHNSSARKSALEQHEKFMFNHRGSLRLPLRPPSTSGLIIVAGKCGKASLTECSPTDMPWHQMTQSFLSLSLQFILINYETLCSTASLIQSSLPSTISDVIKLFKLIKNNDPSPGSGARVRERN